MAQYTGSDDQTILQKIFMALSKSQDQRKRIESARN